MGISAKILAALASIVSSCGVLTQNSLWGFVPTVLLGPNDTLNFRASDFVPGVSDLLTANIPTAQISQDSNNWSIGNSPMGLDNIKTFESFEWVGGRWIAGLSAPRTLVYLQTASSGFGFEFNTTAILPLTNGTQDLHCLDFVYHRKFKTYALTCRDGATTTTYYHEVSRKGERIFRVERALNSTAHTMPDGSLRSRLTGGQKPLLLVFARPQYKDGKVIAETLAKAVFACKWEYQNTNLMDPNCEWSFDVSLLGFDGLIDVFAGPSGWTYCVGTKDSKVVLKTCEILYKDTKITTTYSKEIGDLSTAVIVTQSHVLVALYLKTGTVQLSDLGTDFTLSKSESFSGVTLNDGKVMSCTPRSASVHNGLFSISFEDCSTTTKLLYASDKGVVTPKGTSAVIEDRLYSRDMNSLGAIKESLLSQATVLVNDKPCGDEKKPCLLNICNQKPVCGNIEIQSLDNYSSGPTVPKMKEIQGYFGSKILLPWPLPDKVNGIQLKSLSVSEEFQGLNVNITNRGPTWNLSVTIDGKKLQDAGFVDVSVGDNHLFGITTNNYLVFASCSNLKASLDVLQCTSSVNRVEIPKSMRFLYWKSPLPPRNGQYPVLITSTEEYRPMTTKLVAIATVKDGVRLVTDPKWVAGDIEIFFGADFPSAVKTMPQYVDDLFVVVVSTADSVLETLSKISISVINLKDLSNKTVASFNSTLAATEFFCPRYVSRSTEILGSKYLRVVSTCANGAYPDDYRVIQFDPFSPAAGNGSMRYELKETKIHFNNSVSHICLLSDIVIYSSNYSQDFMASSTNFASGQNLAYLGLSKYGLYDKSGGDANSMAYCLPEYGMALLGHHGLDRDKRWVVASKVAGIFSGLFSSPHFRIAAHEAQPKEVGTYKGSRILRAGKTPIVVHTYQDRAQNGNFYFRTQYLFARPESRLELSQPDIKPQEQLRGFVSATFADVAGNTWDWFQDLHLSAADTDLNVTVFPADNAAGKLFVDSVLSVRGHVAEITLTSTKADGSLPAGLTYNPRVEKSSLKGFDALNQHRVISLIVSQDISTRVYLLYSADNSTVEVFHSAWKSQKSISLPFSYCQVDASDLLEYKSGVVSVLLKVSKPAATSATFYFEVQESGITYQEDLNIPDAKEVKMVYTSERVLVAATSQEGLTYLLQKSTTSDTLIFQRLPKLPGLSSLSLVMLGDGGTIFVTGLEANASSILVWQVRQATNTDKTKVDGYGYYIAKPLAEYRAAADSRSQFHSTKCVPDAKGILCVSDTYGNSLLVTRIPESLGTSTSSRLDKPSSSLPRRLHISQPYVLSVCGETSTWELYDLQANTTYSVASSAGFAVDAAVFGVSDTHTANKKAFFYLTNDTSSDLQVWQVAPPTLTFKTADDLQQAGFSVKAAGPVAVLRVVALKELLKPDANRQKTAAATAGWLWVATAGVLLLAVGAVGFLAFRYCKSGSSDSPNDYSKVSFSGNGGPDARNSQTPNPKASIIDRSSDQSKTYADNEL